MPTSIYPDSMSDEKKEAARVILEQAHALFAKRWTPGSISQPEAYAHGMAPLLPQPGDKPAAISHKFGELKDYANGLAKEMEQVFGVSYPTIKNRLTRLANTLEFVETNPTPSRSEVLDRLKRGEIQAQDAIRELEALR